MNTILVEDNEMALAALEQYCSTASDIVHLASFKNGEDTLAYVNSERDIDLIFLDIEMPRMSGFELMDNLPFSPQVIFTTSNKEYAFDAYEYDVIDFLVKPLEIKRFNKSVQKAVSNYEKRNSVALSSAATELYVRSDGKLIRISYDDVLYFENVGDYIKVITTKGMHVIYGALKSLAERLKHPRFLKVHRSYIVNLDKIVDIEDNSLVIGQKVIPISRAHKPIVMNGINII